MSGDNIKTTLCNPFLLDDFRPKMKLQRKIKFIILVFVPLWLAGCSSMLTKTANSPSATPFASVMVHEQPTKILTSRTQITYIQNVGDDVDGIYAIDVTCQSSTKLCPGEPKLLFQTFPSSSNDPNKPTGLIDNYSWSPDGNQIALSANKEIFIGDMNTQEWVNITNTTKLEEYTPQWSSNGKYIYYLACSYDLGYGVCRLARSSPTGESKTDLLRLVDYQIDDFAVSSDDASVVFSSPKDGFDNLYQSKLDGSDLRPITTAALEDKAPSLSPDARSLAFVRTNYANGGIDNEKADLIMKNLESGKEENLTSELDDEVFSPSFSPAGDWIAFNAYDKDLNSNIFVISINQGGILQVTQGKIDKGGPSWRQFYESQ
jgi:hypothetical protein